MISHSTLENLFLKIFRNTVLILMTITIVVVPILLVTGAYKFLHGPAATPTTEQTLDKDLNINDLKQALLDEANKNNQSATESPKPQSPQKISTKYKEKALEIYKCGESYKRAINGNPESSVAAQSEQEVEFLRSNLERMAGPSTRGSSYVSGVVGFVCKALNDPAIIALKKEGKIGVVLVPAINIYTEAWDEAVKENKEFADSERNKIILDKAEAAIIFYIAAVLFVSFMGLALYLMLSRVENHIGGINETLKKADVSIKL